MVFGFGLEFLVYIWWSWCPSSLLSWRCCYLLGCYIWWTLLHFGAWFDALVLEVILEDLSMVRYTWRWLWLIHLEVVQLVLLVTWTRFWRWLLMIDDALQWLGWGLMIGDLTFDLRCLELDLKILSWISRTLFTCLALELTMTRMDDVMSLRWWSDRCICGGSDSILYSSLQAGSYTL